MGNWNAIFITPPTHPSSLPALSPSLLSPPALSPLPLCPSLSPPSSLPLSLPLSVSPLSPRPLSPSSPPPPPPPPPPSLLSPPSSPHLYLFPPLSPSLSPPSSLPLSVSPSLSPPSSLPLSVSSLKYSTPSSTNVMDMVDPIDYEKFLTENAPMLETDPHRDLLIFPEDDVSVTSLPRKHRTIEIPVPGPAK